MLGIRYINNTAVDLWVGNPSEFSVDLMFDLATLDETNSLQSTLKQIDEKKIRHLGIIFPTPTQESTTQLFEDLKSFCGWYPERITIILKSITEYNMVQKLMFSLLLKRS